MLGATAVIQQAQRSRASPWLLGPWLLGLLARKRKKLAAVALANKMARTLWAMMVSGETLPVSAGGLNLPTSETWHT